MNEDIYEIAKKLVTASKRAYNRGIQTGSGGNVSARIPGTETMLVKASGGSLGDCTPEGFLITDFDGNLIEGNGKPTREALLHGYIYKMREDVNAVVHVHAPYAIGWSSSKKDLPRVTWHSRLKMPSDIPNLDGKTGGRPDGRGNVSEVSGYSGLSAGGSRHRGNGKRTAGGGTHC